MANIDERLLAGNTLEPEEENSTARELREERRSSSSETAEDRGEEEGPRSLRQRVQAARQALNLKEQAKKKIEEKVTAPASILKTKLLNLIPGYGPYIVFKNAVLMKKGKFTLIDVIIMLFSNLNTCFMVLAALALTVLIVAFATNPITAVKAIMDLGWVGIEALIQIFKN